MVLKIFFKEWQYVIFSGWCIEVLDKSLASLRIQIIIIKKDINNSQLEVLKKGLLGFFPPRSTFIHPNANLTLGSHFWFSVLPFAFSLTSPNSTLIANKHIYKKVIENIQYSTLIGQWKKRCPFLRWGRLEIKIAEGKVWHSTNL